MDDPEIDLVELDRRIKDKELPLIACRTKSGGAHCYLFGAEPLKADLLRKTLKTWSEWLGYAGHEIFPKQSTLKADNDGVIPKGNWLNMPYFDAHSTDRYAVEGGRKVPPEYFLELAEASKVTNADLVKLARGEHSEAPPCLQRMLSEGIKSGHRNNALYNFTVYLRKQSPETYRDKAMDINARVFDKPLPYDEAKRTIASAGRRDYRYKCGEEPCRSLCDSAACVKREFGITEDESQILNLGEVPIFSKLDKYLTDPIKWVLYVDDKPLPAMLVRDLHSYKSVREATSEILNRVPPSMKNDKWSVILDNLMQDCRIIEAPDDASVAGVVRSHLEVFMSRANKDVDPDDTNERQKLTLGNPIYQTIKGRLCICFTGTAFVGYLKKSRAEEAKGSNLWMILRKAGIDHTKLRHENSSINVWYTPVKNKTQEVELIAQEFKHEF